MNQNLSAHAYRFVNYNFNKKSLAPPGSKVVIHAKPTEQHTWNLDGKEGFYVGSALNHYW